MPVPDAVQAGMEVVRCQMQKYRTTRKILSKLDRNSPKNGCDSREFEEMDIQRRLTDAISTYGASIEKAFEALLRAVETLESEGFSEDSPGAAVAKSLLRGLRESGTIVKKAVSTMNGPLEVHAAAIDVCLNDLMQASHYSNELRRYQEKVETLAEESEHSENEARKDKHEVRLGRNRSKLTRAEYTAQEAEAHAKESLKKVQARKVSLGDMAESAIVATVEALQASLRHLDASPTTDRLPQATAVARSNLQAAPTLPPTGSSNPFETDCVDLTAQQANSRSPFIASSMGSTPASSAFSPSRSAPTSSDAPPAGKGAPLGGKGPSVAGKGPPVGEGAPVGKGAGNAEPEDNNPFAEPADNPFAEDVAEDVESFPTSRLA